MKTINPRVDNSIEYATKYFFKYRQQCENIAKYAKELVAEAHLEEYFLGDITCEYQPADGLVIVFELDDGYAPHNIGCSSFFGLFSKNIKDITIDNIKGLNI